MFLPSEAVSALLPLLFFSNESENQLFRSLLFFSNQLFHQLF